MTQRSPGVIRCTSGRVRALSKRIAVVLARVRDLEEDLERLHVEAEQRERAGHAA